MSIPVFKPSIRRRDMHSVLSCLVTDVIGPASLSEDLVAAACAEYGHEGGRALREHARAVELVLRSLGLGEGDKAVISPLAPPAYARAFRAAGVTPLFADVREADACIDPEAALARIEDGAKALFVHAPLGRVPETAPLAEAGVPVVVDVGEALGARSADAMLGADAAFLVMPMEPEAIATSGGGTLVLARDKAGLSALSAAAEELSADVFLPDLNASLGLVQWREYPQALESREQIAEVFAQAVMKGRHRGLADPRDEEARAVPYSFPVVLATGMNEVRRYARKKGVETLPAFAGRMMDAYPEAAEDCPEAKKLMMNVLLFPLYPTLGKKNVQHLVKVISTLP